MSEDLGSTPSGQAAHSSTSGVAGWDADLQPGPSVQRLCSLCGPWRLPCTGLGWKELPWEQPEGIQRKRGWFGGGGPNSHISFALDSFQNCARKMGEGRGSVVPSPSGLKGGTSCSGQLVGAESKEPALEGEGLSDPGGCLSG